MHFTIRYPAHRFHLARHLLLQACLAGSALSASSAHAAADAEGADSASESADLTKMSLSELANLDVTSVSKASEVLQRAPATIYVITHEDIVRSGATSVIEALRLAPNLLVQQQSSDAYTISARGLGGDAAAQNFSNKLLMLIDGRSVYTPLFSGIYANTVDVMLEDVERIEVISGVGATLWGANAMNGVINIITRASYLTQGAFLDAGAGNSTQFVDLREGGRVSEDLTARAYAFGFHRGSELLPGGATARDGWNKGQAGFRGDWSSDRDAITVQGDYYHGAIQVLNNSDALVQGGNLLTRYEHRGDESDLQVQLYADQTEQFGPGDSTGFVVHTYDLSLQHSLQVGSSHRLVWGGGERLYSYGITDSPSLIWNPPARNLTLANVFAQDTFTVVPGVNLVYGLKLEDDPYSGWSALPDVRISFALGEHETLWAAASRAIRSPTPFDEDVVEHVPGIGNALIATGRFRPEELIGYELGFRAQPARAFSFSVTPFYDVYDHLRTVDPSPAGGFFPLYFGNELRGAAFGVGTWGDWQVTDRWRLSPGMVWVRDRLSFEPGASQLLGTVQAGNDPSVHASLTSSFDLPRHVTLDATWRYMGALPEPVMSHYYELDARLGWQLSPDISFSLNGQNLLHQRHTELPTGPGTGGEEILRSVLAEVRWRF
ncbi:MAG TPA: TonB-dependent receptor [Steroidobacteraceae bacterium]|nr:TonB-dependent receptor [Steroidobacteraceae bacterium]